MKKLTIALLLLLTLCTSAKTPSSDEYFCSSAEIRGANASYRRPVCLNVKFLYFQQNITSVILRHEKGSYVIGISKKLSSDTMLNKDVMEIYQAMEMKEFRSVKFKILKNKNGRLHSFGIDRDTTVAIFYIAQIEKKSA